MSLVGDGIERTGSGKRERFALGFEGPFVSDEERVSAGDGRVQVNRVATLIFFPIANVFADELDVVIFVRELDLERGDGRTGNRVIHHTAAVGDAFADGKQMEAIHLNGLRHAFDAHGRLP